MVYIRTHLLCILDRVKERLALRIAEDYVQLRFAFQEYADQQPFHITMDQLAQALFCTPRNAKLIITKMEQVCWVEFRSGRGRGNTSELTFLHPVTTVLLEEAKQRVLQGDVQSAFDWLQAHEPLAIVRPLFLEWLMTYFGHSRQQIGQDRMIETLRLPIYRPIVSLEPANAMYAFDTHLVHQIYSRLVQYDHLQQTFTKDIAHHWEVNEDATCWTFYLHKGIAFHNGQELTAQDVDASLTRLQDPSVIHHWLVQDIDHIQVIHRYQIQITLRRPNTQFLFYMSHSAASISPASSLLPYSKHILPIGSGPYQVVSHHPGKCTLTLFSSYFGYKGFIDQIEIIIVPENEAEACFGTSPGVLTVVTGELEIPADLQMPLTQTVTGVSTLTFNLRKDTILQDSRFREVLVQGINRLQMTEELGATHLCPASGLHIQTDAITSGFLESLVEQSEYTAIRESMLAQLQHTPYAGETLHLYTFARHATDAYWLQQQYQTFGIVIQVHIVTWAETIQPDIMEQADLMLFEAMVSDQPIGLLEYVQSDRNWIRYFLPAQTVHQLDQLTQHMLASSAEHAIANWSSAVNQLFHESWTSAFLVVRTASTIYHPSLRGVHVNHKGWVDFATLWFQET